MTVLTPRRGRRLTASAVVATAVAAIIAVAPAGAASDTTLAKTGVITSKDVPKTWESTAADPDSSDALETIAAEFSECSGYLDARDRLDRAAGNAVSRDFSSPNGETLSDETWVFAKTAQAKAAFDALGGSTVDDCLTAVFQKALYTQLAGEQISGVQTTISAVSSLPSDGDDQLGYAGIVTVTYPDGSAEYLFVAFFAIRTDRGILGYTVTAPSDAGGSLSKSYTKPAEKAISTTATRMESALKKG